MGFSFANYTLNPVYLKIFSKKRSTFLHYRKEEAILNILFLFYYKTKQ
jgi:hypothetical protein